MMENKDDTKAFEESAESKERIEDKTEAKKKIPPKAGKISQDQKNLSLLCHLSGLLLYIAPGLNIIVPLVIFLLKRDVEEFVTHHSRQALFFQFIMTIAMAVFFVLSFLIIGIPFLVVLFILHIVFTLVATFAASRGEWYFYPLMEGF
jgi:uncharacterized Tic20 family protein